MPIHVKSFVTIALYLSSSGCLYFNVNFICFLKDINLKIFFFLTLINSKLYFYILFKEVFIEQHLNFYEIMIHFY